MVECPIVVVESGHCVLLFSGVQDILSYHFCFQCASLQVTIFLLAGLPKYAIGIAIGYGIGHLMFQRKQEKIIEREVYLMDYVRRHPDDFPELGKFSIWLLAGIGCTRELGTLGQWVPGLCLIIIVTKITP